MTLVWEHAPYSEGSLLVLLALADWADDNGVAWPSVPKLAQKSRLQRRRVQYIVRKLANDGFLEIEEGGGRSKQHRYALNLEKLKGAHNAPFSEIPAEINGAINAPFSGNGALGDKETVHFGAERVHSETQTVHSSAPDPLEEPLEEPSIEPPEASPPFSGNEFTQALTAYVAHRQEIKKPLKSRGLAQLYNDLGKWGETRATQALTDAIRNGWQGVFEPKGNADAGAPKGLDPAGNKILADFGDWYTVMGFDGTPSKRFRTVAAKERDLGIKRPEASNGTHA